MRQFRKAETPNQEKTSWERTFNIDLTNSDEQYLYVDLPGRGTVAIKADDDGIVVDLFPLHVVDNAVASCWATYAELSTAE